MFPMLGYLLLLAATAFIIPLLALFFFPSETFYALPFFLTAFVLAALGLSCLYLHRYGKKHSIKSEKNLSLAFGIAFLIVIAGGAVPFISILKITFSRAIFESVNAWTATAFSTLRIERIPKVLLLHRSILQLYGGLAWATLMITAFSCSCEGFLCHTPSEFFPLKSTFFRSLKVVTYIYTACIVLSIPVLIFLGMSIFDAINHAFTAISTGGYSTRASSYWNSPKINLAMLYLMLLGSANFLTLAFIGTRKRGSTRRPRGLYYLPFLALPGLFILVTALMLGSHSDQLHVQVFRWISALSTTGFNSGPLEMEVPESFLLVILMISGGSICSAAGGLSGFRISVLLKSLYLEIRRLFLPKNAVMKNTISLFGGTYRANTLLIKSTNAYVAFYGIFCILGVGILSCLGYGLDQSIFEVSSALSTVGLSSGIINQETPLPVLWTLSACMVAGRFASWVLLLSPKGSHSSS